MALVLPHHSSSYDNLLNTTLSTPDGEDEAPTRILDEEESVDVEIELYMSLDPMSAELEDVVGMVVEKLQKLGYSVTVTPQVSYWGFSAPGASGTPMVVVNGVVAYAARIPGPEELFAQILAILAGLYPEEQASSPFMMGPHRPSPSALAAAPVG
ncbi:MAG: hypothetical protein GXO09_01355 [Crenarchaeota archaeon]|nr:hypothetical protein [Thermoproteota archaeon]